MTRVRVLPLADHDVDEAADEYTKVGGVELGIRFLEAVERTWFELARHPEVGAAVQWGSLGLAGVRRWRISNPFHVYSVYYRFSQEDLVVIRVLHAARDHERLL